MIRLERARTARGKNTQGRRAGETPIAVARGGAWDGRVAYLGDPEFVEETPELEWFEGLAAPDGCEFIPMPCTAPEQRDVVFIAGPSGSGKSTFAAEMAGGFAEMFAGPDGPPLVVIICPDDPERDAAFRESGVKYTWVSPAELKAEPVGLEVFEGAGGSPSLVIFDDVDALGDKGEAEAVERVSKAILERGRKRGIHAYHIAHRPAAGRATKTVLQEQNGVWFPTAGGADGNLSYMLKTHLGIPPDLRAALKKNSREFGRWAFIKTDATPRWACTPKRLFTVDPEEIEACARAGRRTAEAVARAELAEELKTAAQNSGPNTNGLASLTARRRALAPE
jgi:hypothetical protein